MSLPKPGTSSQVDPRNPPYDPQLCVCRLQRHLEPMAHRDGAERRPCGYTWRQYQDGPFECPQCVPDQPRPFAVRLADPNEFLGAGWVWDEAFGAHGYWRPREDFVLVPRVSFETLLEAVREKFVERGAVKFEQGQDLVSQIAEWIDSGLIREKEPFT